MVADFARFYGIDLARALYGPGPLASPGMLWALAEGMPADAQWRHVYGGPDEAAGWSMDRHLAAGVFDAVAASAGSDVRWPRPKAAGGSPAGLEAAAAAWLSALGG